MRSFASGTPRKSERYDPSQLALFEKAKDNSSVAEAPPVEDNSTGKKRRRGGTGRRRLDPSARREQRIHRLREDQKECPKCGSDLVIVLVELPSEVRHAQRQTRALPLLDDFKKWLDELAPTMVPKTELAAAVGYALNQWAAFVRYCDEGWLMIDNTRSERALRPIAIGRNNWMFFGSDEGGHTGAILYSLVASCKANRIHPYHYLNDVYTRLPAIRQHASLLPLLQAACAEVRFPDGTRPNLEAIRSPLDCLRVLKNHPRPLIEQFRAPACQLDRWMVDELNALLPDCWHDAHRQFHLKINRKTRLVGDAA